MRLAWHAAAVAGLALLAACAASERAGPERAAAPAAGIHGEVVAVSDVQGEGEWPIREGYVLAIPGGRADRLWAAAGRSTPEEHELPYWNPSLSPAAVEDAGGTVAGIDGDGAFELDVPPGDYLLCLARDAGLRDLGGCARATLTGDDRLRMTFGEGGVRLEATD